MRVVASGAASAAAATRASRRSAASSTRRALLPPPPPPRRRDVVVVVGARRPRQHRGGVALARATPPSDDVASSPDLLEVVEPTLVEPRGGGGGDDDDDDATPSTSASTSGAASDPDPAAAVSTAAARTVLGVEMRPEVAAIVLVYFVQGILGLSRLAKDYFLKDDLHLSPAEASLVLSVSAAPWLVKPVWGFISDSVPLFGYRRKSYLVLCGALGAVAGFGLSAYVTDVPGAVIAFTAGSLSTAFADVVIDSVVVAAARGESQATSGSLQSLCWGSVALGGIASAYFSGALIEERGTRFVFGVTALFPLLIAAAATLVNEKRIVDPSDRGDAPPSPSPSSSSHPGIVDEIKILGGKLWDVGKDRRVWAPTAFVFLWQATPNPGAAMFYFQTEALGFTPEFLGRVALARSVAALVGVGVYNAYLKDVPLKKMFTVSAVLGTCLGLTQLILVAGLNREWGISDQFFSLGDTVVLTVLGEVSFLPVLVLAAKTCPEGVEATLFAALMSVFNAGGAASAALGAALTAALGVTEENFDGLFALVLICNLSSLVPLLGLRWLDEADGGEGGGGGEGGAEGVPAVADAKTD